jgi:hypothetical protein
MRKGSMLVASAIAIALGFAGVASANDRDNDRTRERGGSVIPCSLDGVNPVYHPEIFGNAAVARSYGFVKGRDGTWQVMANCRAH